MANTEPGPARDGQHAGRAWRSIDDDSRRRGAAEPSNGLRGFLRKLAALFSLDPRSSGR